MPKLKFKIPKVPYAQIFFGLVLILIVCIFSVWLFTRSYLWPEFNLIGKGEIGDVIGGITGPITGILGIILLYLTFTAQKDALAEQKKAFLEEKNWNKKRLIGDIINYNFTEVKEEYGNLEFNSVSEDRVKGDGEKTTKKGMYAYYTLIKSHVLFNADNIDPILNILYGLKHVVETIDNKNTELLGIERNYFKKSVKDFYRFKIRKGLKIIYKKSLQLRDDKIQKEIEELKSFFDIHL